MTVAQLKAELNKYPASAQVLLLPLGFECLCQPIQSVQSLYCKDGLIVCLDANVPEEKP